MTRDNAGLSLVTHVRIYPVHPTTFPTSNHPSRPKTLQSSQQTHTINLPPPRQVFIDGPCNIALTLHLSFSVPHALHTRGNLQSITDLRKESSFWMHFSARARQLYSSDSNKMHHPSMHRLLSPSYFCTGSSQDRLTMFSFFFGNPKSFVGHAHQQLGRQVSIALISGTVGLGTTPPLFLILAASNSFVSVSNAARRSHCPDFGATGTSTIKD